MGRTKRAETANWVSIAIAEDLEHARDCQRVLKEHEIECLCRPQTSGDEMDGVVVIVPEEQADAAHAILAERNSPEDFFDFGFDDAATDDDLE
jgi:RNA polymerase subunit RPABC4/transcription elongation factor Spt4